MATREFKLPDVGEGVAEGELVRWLVEPGDRVSEDQPVAEVETDKALVEVPSPYDGAVAELRAEEGEVVPVGTVIITFDVPDEPEMTEGGEVAEPDQAESTEGEDGGGADVDESADSEGARPGPTRAFAPPSLRRLARELGVDLAAVADESGRVSERAIREAAGGGESTEERGTATEGGAEPPASRGEATTGELERERRGGDGSAPAGRERTLATPATRAVARDLGVDIDDVPATERRDGEAFVTAEAVRAHAGALERGEVAGGAEARASERERERVPGQAASPGGDARPGGRVPYRGVRRSIGEQMERSAFTAPQVTHHDDADATALVRVRTDLVAAAEERGVRLTYTPFVLKAVATALAEFPVVNAELDEERGEIRLHDEYNVGVATATDAGLMVPVVEDVDEKGLLELAREVNALSERARERTITREEMQGGTFTVTNVGVIGGEYATPLVNYPEVAILALGAIRERPRVVDGEVVARQTLPLSLSVDHRVVDGAVAARFTNRVVELLGEPARLLLG